MKIEYEGTFSASRCADNPDKIYVFGDNLLRRGYAGQATIRGQANAFGIPTKRYPNTQRSAYFSDQPDELESVKQALRELYILGKKNYTIVFPTKGIGTGLARMQEHSPKIYTYMCETLERFFGIVNESSKRTQ